MSADIAVVVRLSNLLLAALLIVLLAGRMVHARDRTDGTYILGMVVMASANVVGSVQFLSERAPLKWGTPLVTLALLLLLWATQLSRRRSR